MTHATADPARPPCLAVDIGGTKTSAAIVLPDNTIQAQLTHPTPAAAGPHAVLGQVVSMLRDLATRIDHGDPPVAVGVGTAGIVDPETGVVVGATHHIRDWVGTHVRRDLGRALRLPTYAVNDVHAHALGEAVAGVGAGLDTILLIAAGTGIGGAVVRHGELDQGRHGAAGHLGHTPCEEATGLRCACGRTGHLEALASGPGLTSLYVRQGGTAERAHDVVEAARAGDRLAAQCVAYAGRALGRAIGGWTNLLDPDAVILTGGLAHAGPQWRQALTDAAEEERITLLRDCPIVPATTGSAGALIGAAHHARLRLATDNPGA